MNKLLTPKEAAKGMLEIVQQNIKEMKENGMNEKQIKEVLNDIFAGFMYGKM